jgi:endonuclease/exonuclease/phosphatase family metal-dependent hydrolase
MASTFPAAWPIRPLDGIFVRGDVRAHGCSPVIDPLTRSASDHLPLVAELDLRFTPSMHAPAHPHLKHSTGTG